MAGPASRGYDSPPVPLNTGSGSGELPGKRAPGPRRRGAISTACSVDPSRSGPVTRHRRGRKPYAIRTSIPALAQTARSDPGALEGTASGRAKRGPHKGTAAIPGASSTRRSSQVRRVVSQPAAVNVGSGLPSAKSICIMRGYPPSTPRASIPAGRRGYRLSFTAITVRTGLYSAAPRNPRDFLGAPGRRPTLAHIIEPSHWKEIVNIVNQARLKVDGRRFLAYN